MNHTQLDLLTPLQPTYVPPAPIRQPEPEPPALCVLGNRIYLAHEWSVRGPCKRCQRPFPKQPVKSS